MSTITPNMNLVAPTPSDTTGPQWAEDIVGDLNSIDSHDHSPGKGVAITPDGMNVNADLPMNSHNLTEVRTVRFDAQGAALSDPSDVGCLYEVGDDLYYNDGAGNQVRITQGGSVTGSTGTITGLPSGTASASFAAGTFTFQSATNTPAVMAVGPLVVGRQTLNSKTVTISPNAGQGANYALTLPAALPGSTSILNSDASGNISYSATTGTGDVVLATSPTIASPTVTGAIENADGSASAPSYSFTSNSNLGMYRTSNTLNFATAGVRRLAIDANQAIFAGNIQGPVSSGSAPTFSFENDPDTGMYQAGANTLGFATGGTVNTAISVDGISTDQGTTFIKWKVFTGTLSGSASTTLSGPGSIVLGVVGYTSKNNGGTNWVPMSDGVSASTGGIYYFTNLASSGGNELVLQNTSANSRSYRVVMYYQ